MSTARPGFNTRAMSTGTADAEEITRASKSNLAFAFVSLGKERRRDITIFYAFCWLIDDIADSNELSPDEKARRLTVWREALRGSVLNEPALVPEVRRLMTRYPVTPAMLDTIIDGVEMDLTISSYENFAALREYCYRVASAVGLVSIEIFGYKNPACKEYAVELGLALQMTNILRDVGRDLDNGRIYLPREDIAQLGYSEADLSARTYNDQFVRLMQFEANRAREFFGRAAVVLPKEDRKSMIGAEIMGSIYRALLKKMERDRYQVFARDYRISTPAKCLHVARQLLKLF